MELRADPEFAFLTVIARLLNAFKFGAASAGEPDPVPSPAVYRQSMGRLLYLAGLLHELLIFRDKHQQRYESFESYKSIFTQFDSSIIDPVTAELVSKIRNRAAFHFDPTIPERTLPSFNQDGYTFVAGRGRRRIEAAYELADMTTFFFIFGPLADAHKVYERFTTFRDSLDDLVARFTRAADHVLLARLLELGFEMQEGPFPDDT